MGFRESVFTSAGVGHFGGRMIVGEKEEEDEEEGEEGDGDGDGEEAAPLEA